MFKLIESNGKNTKEVLSNDRIIWKPKKPSDERTGADLGLDQNNLIYSGMATIRVDGSNISISLGRQDYNRIRKRRLIVIYGKYYNISTMGVSDINNKVVLIGYRRASLSIRSLIASVSLRNTNSVGNSLLDAKDIEAHIEIYQ